MNKIIPLAGSLALLWLFQTVVSKYTLVIFHPFWNIKATLIGGAIGLALLVVMMLLDGRFPSAVKALSGLAVVLFIAAMGLTWYEAGIFVNSENFEPLAGRIWFFSYIVSMATLVPVAALIIRKFMPAKF